ncbi:MAG: gfo/Idh/MocA family oxidoreductase, partial [Pirellulaceae bacterium]|nr:gfo/Idh/MocA family oxidoreductase [Pirellulaceae bacterium]
SYDGYRPLLVEIVSFFRSGKPPVSATETIEIYAFMEAADVSKRSQGASVAIEALIKEARIAALKKLAQLD